MALQLPFFVSLPLVSVGLFAALSLSAATRAQAQLGAFPSATGFGAATTGGRGGRVIHVTTLAASGSGSLAAAAAATGARIIVFDVSGVIQGDVEITNGNVTIAGQTAPGAGITINGHLSTPYGDALSNIIVRHVRIRPPGPGGEWPAQQHDAILMSDVSRVIMDHVDVSHGVDELVDHYDGANQITWQSSIFSFPNPSGGHPDGAHPYGLLNWDGDDPARGGRISIVGNLFAHCRARTPALGTGPAEVINNVVYGGREGFVHHNDSRGDFVIAGNTYRDGPGNSLAPFWFDGGGGSGTRYFMGDNLVDEPSVFTGKVDNPFSTSGFTSEYDIGEVQSSQFLALSSAPVWGSPRVAVTRVPQAEAYEAVLSCAGAWPRDFVSTTAVSETRGRTGSMRNLALSNLMQGLTPGTAPPDGDGDGMPDAWETSRGLNPATADHNMPLEGGWPAIEVYLEERSRAITCPGSTPIPTGSGGAGGGAGTGAAGTSGAAGVGGGPGGAGGRGGTTGGAAGTTGAAGRGGSTGGAAGRGGAAGGAAGTSGTAGTSGAAGRGGTGGGAAGTSGAAGQGGATGGVAGSTGSPGGSGGAGSTTGGATGNAGTAGTGAGGNPGASGSAGSPPVGAEPGIGTLDGGPLAAGPVIGGCACDVTGSPGTGALGSFLLSLVVAVALRTRRRRG